MILLLLLITIGATCFYHFFWKRRNLPPGPLPFPLIGNLHMMASYPPGYELWRYLTKQYGPVFTFWMSHMPIVMVTDWELIKQHFIKDGANYVGRPMFPISIEMRKGPFGVIESFGERWVQQRRFALHVLRNFGLGKNLMEEKVIHETQSLTENLRRDAQKGGVDLQNHLDAAVGSIINNILFGYRYDESNMDEFLTLKGRMDKHFKMAAEPMGGIVGMYPFVGKLPVFKKYRDVIVDNWDGLFQEFRKQYKEHEAVIDYDNDDYSDFTEAFLKERKKHEHEPDFGGFEYEQLESVCFDLWIAGMETTSNTLYWGVLYTLLCPRAYEKVKEELKRVIGSDRIITSADKNSLNYVNAAINETQRCANLLPMNVSRATVADVVIDGHHIPSGTTISPQISCVLLDERVFPEPYEFRPERFLDNNGNLIKVEELVPFSIGKRQCLGEGLARLELFIFYANFFNQFEVSFDPAGPKPTVKKNMGITMKAENYSVLLKPQY